MNAVLDPPIAVSSMEPILTRQEAAAQLRAMSEEMSDANYHDLAPLYAALADRLGAQEVPNMQDFVKVLLEWEWGWPT